jgi:hypothetical protein
MTRSLPARIAAADRRAVIKVGLATLNDDELLRTIEAVRRVLVAQDAGAAPDPQDVALTRAAAILQTLGSQLTALAPREQRVHIRSATSLLRRSVRHR